MLVAGLIEPDSVEMALAACDDRMEEADEQTEDNEMDDSEEELGEPWPVELISANDTGGLVDRGDADDGSDLSDE